MNDSGDPYVYPGTTTLRNLLGQADPGKLDRAERRIVAERATQPIPRGSFDLDHLCAIHRHLFQDVYDWAGELRTVEISKGNQQFQFRRYIQTGISDVHRRLVQVGYLSGLSAEAFAAQAAVIVGDINYVHPFREGNGRTQLHYLKQLTGRAGHSLDLTHFGGPEWLAASISSHKGNYGPMTAAISRALRPPPDGR